MFFDVSLIPMRSIFSACPAVSVYERIRSYRATVLAVAAAVLGLSAQVADASYSVAGTNPMPTLQFGARTFFIDADGDGDLDLLTQNGIVPKVGIELRISDGAGGFSATHTVDSTTGLFTSGPMSGVVFDRVNFSADPSLFAVDINHDGTTDLVEFNNNAPGRILLRNPGVNAGWISQSGSGTLPQLTFANRVFFADFNNDGKIDLLVQNGSTLGEGISMYLNTSTGGVVSFSAAIEATAGAFTSGPFASFSGFTNIGSSVTYFYEDYDNDGDKDIIEHVNGGPGRIFKNEGSSWTIVANTLPSLQFAGRLAFLDLDSDGDLDIFYQNGNSPGVGIGVGINDGAGNFSLIPATAGGGSAAFSTGPLNGHSFTLVPPNQVFSMDFDFDGDLDIVEVPSGVAGRILLRDGSPPVLASSIPADNAANVSPTTDITLTFDQDVTKGAGNITIRRTADNFVIETIAVSSAKVTGAGATWTINPDATLPGGTGISVNVDAGAFMGNVGGMAFPGILDNFGLNFVTSSAEIGVTLTSAPPPTSEVTNGEGFTFSPAVALGASVSQTIHIHNVGGVPLTGLVTSKGGSHHGEYAITQPSVTTLAVGASTSFQVTFTPAAATSGRTATIQIASNDPDDNPFEIVFTGTGANTTPQVSLAVETTSLGGTDSKVVPGEIVTYSMEITTVEGLTNGLSLAAILPTGTAFVPGSSSIVPGTFAGSLPAPTESAVIGALFGDGTDVAFDFGQITSTQDADPGNNTFKLTFDVVVLDVPGNVDGNSLTLSGTRASTGNTEAPITNSPSVDVVAPSLTLVQAFSLESGGAGTPFTIGWTVAHAANSTSTAYDLNLGATLPSGLTYTSGLTAFIGATDVSSSFSVIGGVITTTGTLDLLEGEELVVSIPVTVDSGVGGGTSLTNDVSLAYSSYPGDQSESGGFDPNPTVSTDRERISELLDSDDFVAADIALTSTSLDENNTAGAVVATLSSPGAGGSPAFTFANGVGSVDNGKFSIAGNSLVIDEVADFETQSSYSIRLAMNNGAGVSVEKAIIISVNDVNEAPTISAIADVSINEDQNTGAISFTVGDQDAGDLAGLVVSVAYTDNTMGTDPSIVHGGSGANRTVTLTPAANSFGSATVTLTVADSGGLEVTESFVLTVNSVNDAPTFVDAGDITILEDSGPYSAQWATAISAGPANESTQSLEFSVSATNTTLFSIQPSVSASGVLSFTPAADAYGTSTFTVTLTDDGGTANGGVNSVTRQFTLTITGINDVPTLAEISDPDVIGVNAGLQTVNLTGIGSGASNENQTLVITATSSNLTLIPNPTVTYTSPAATGTLSFIPASNQVGTAVITVTVNDGGGTANGGVETISRTFTVTVDPRADLSVLVSGSPDPVDAGSNVTYTIQVRNHGASTATDVELTNIIPTNTKFVSFTAPNGWTSTVPAVGATGTVSSSIPSLSTGMVSFTLVVSVDYVNNNTVLSNTATVESEVVDPDENNNSGNATVTVSAIPAIALFNGASDAAPAIANGQVAEIDYGNTTVGNAVTRTFTVKNVGTGTLTLSSFSVPAGFTLVGGPFTGASIPPTQSSSFAIRFDAAQIGTADGNVVIGSNDASNSSFVFPIRATRTNVAPVAIGQNLSTDEDVNLSITLTGTDDDTEQTLTYSVTSGPANGTLSGTAPDLTYTPATNYFGPDSFNFVVNDGIVSSAPVTVAITVNSVNDAPVVIAEIPDEVIVTPGGSAMIALTSHFNDVETAPADLVYTVSPASGTFYSTNMMAGGSLVITSTAPGVVDLTVTATDADGVGVSDTFQLRVKHVPEVVGTGVPDTVVSPLLPDHTLDLAGYFADQDNDVLTYSVVSNSDPSKVTYTLNGSQLVLHPESPGQSTFVVRVEDSDGNAVQDEFIVTVEDPVPTLTPTVGFTPKLNLQTGLYEISITAANNNIFPIPGFRVRVTGGLPGDITLRNASSAPGTNEPYLDVVAPLVSGQSITVVLEFHSPTRNFENFAPVIVAEPLPGGVTDVGTGAGQDIQVSQIRMLPGGAGLLIEFDSVPGATYQIEYTSNLLAGPWKKSMVPVQAGANKVQWIDRGPPYTDAHPGTVGSRFYRVSRID